MAGFYAGSELPVVRQQIACSSTKLILWDPARLNGDFKVEPECPQCAGKAGGGGWAMSPRTAYDDEGMVWIYTKRCVCNGAPSGGRVRTCVV